MAQFPFIGPSYSARVRKADAQRSINLYPEISSPTSKNVASLIGTPGMRLFANFGTNGIRGLLRFNASTLVVVCGSSVYKTDRLGNVTLIGNIDARTTPVSMDTNGQFIMLVTGGVGSPGYFICPDTNTVTLINDPNFLGADSVCCVDGYFVFNESGTARFRYTELYSTVIRGLNVASVEGAPGILQSIVADYRELWMFKETTTEVFFNSGNADNVFQRINGAFLEIGIAAPRSACKAGGAVYWLTLNDEGAGMIVRSEGYVWRRVSDHAIEHSIASYDRIDDAIAYSYQQEGHTFYVLNFPTADATWVYDTATEQWHERAWRDPATGLMHRHRAICMETFNNRVLVGDHSNGNVCYLDLDYYADVNDYIKRIRRAPHLADGDMNWMRFNSLAVDMTTGVGNQTGDSTDPVAVLRWSVDGGSTWSNEHPAKFGRAGERLLRVMWRRLGRSRDRVFEVSITEKVRVEFVSATINVNGGRT